MGAFANDERILAWDVWNEPGADNAGSYPNEELKEKDIARVTALLPQVFEWAREANPKQPLTSGVWDVDTSPDGGNLGELQQIQLRESDIITFHNYSWPEYFKREVDWLKKYNRPVICTEFMARSAAARLTRCCRLRSRSGSGRSIGDSSPARRRRICPGSHGSIPTS